VAYLLTPEDTKSSLVGFENHWNVFHFKKHGLDRLVAGGLACFLNSTVLDSYFRVFSGHTQVNATDLRNMAYPSLEQLQLLGSKYRGSMSQEDIDNLVTSL
jgi:adenine-specific DNA-methyltransferase